MFSWCVSIQHFQFCDRSSLVANMELSTAAAIESAVPSTTLVQVHKFPLHRKRIFVIIFILAVILLSAIVSTAYYLFYYQQSSTALSIPVPLVSYVPFEEAMNKSIDPCDDFYEFACGNWANSNQSFETDLPFVTPFTVLQNEIEVKLQRVFEQLSINPEFPQVLNSAISFYQSCIKGMDEEIQYSSSLKSVFKKIGGWPLLLGSSWNETAFDWASATVHLIQLLSIESGFGIRVGVNFENTSENLLVIKPPSLTKDTLSNFMAMFYCVASGFNPSLTDEQIETELLQTVAFEQQFRHALKSQNIFKNRKMSISDLQKEIPLIDWLWILQHFTNYTLCPFHCLSSEDEVIVNNIESLKNIIDFISHWNGTKRDIANFYSWLAVADLHHIIPGVFKKYGEYFGYEQSELQSLVKQKCYDTVDELFSYALDYLFIKSFSYFDIKDSTKLVQYSKSAFRKLINTSDWLDRETKSRILLKLDNMFDVVGYPNVYSNRSELDKLCDKFPIMTDDVIQNYVESSKYLIDTNLYRLKHTNTLSNYILPRRVTHVSAYYDLNRNIIVFPLSIQNPPFYYFKGPWYLNFGGIGSMIGHEINHGFDDLGHMYDKNGNLENWWTNNSIDEFYARLSCFKEQFDKYEYNYKGLTKKVNGTRTLGENMADSSGLRQAYLAYKLWEKDINRDPLYPGLPQFDQDQMFFISFASIWCSKSNRESSIDYYEYDSHSPPRLRVIGALSNSEDFARAFKCPKNSPMNPSNKCTIW